MKGLRLLLGDRLSAVAITLIAAGLMLLQAIAGQAAELAAATGQGSNVLCSAALGPTIPVPGEDGRHGAALCAECCAVCHLAHALALPPPDVPRAEPIRPATGYRFASAPRAPPVASPRGKNALTRGPPTAS